MKKIEEVKIDWMDINSIHIAEVKKAKLENLGYRLVSSQDSPFSGKLVYQKGA